MANCPQKHDFKRENNKEKGSNDFEFGSYNSELLKNYFIPFTGKSNADEGYDLLYDNAAVAFKDKAAAVAKKYGQNEINHYHILSVIVDESIELINQIDKGKLYFRDIKDSATTISAFANAYGDYLIENEEYRNEFLKYLEKEKKVIDNILETMPKDKSAKNKNADIPLSSAVMNDINTYRECIDRYGDDVAISYVDIFYGVISTQFPEVEEINNDIVDTIHNITMTEKSDNSRRLSFECYDEKAESVLRKLDFNTHAFLTFDSQKVRPNYIIPCIKKAFEKGGYKLNPKNTEIIEYNDNIAMQHFVDSMYKLGRNDKKNYIVILPQGALFKNSMHISENTAIISQFSEFSDLMKNTPDNIHFVVIDSKDNYLQYNSTWSDVYNNFAEISIPVLDTKDMLNAFMKNKKMKEHYAKKFTNDALEKTILMSSQMDGIFPDKTFGLIKKIQNSSIDKQKITVNDVENFIKDFDYLFKQEDKDSSVEIIFDTNKNLNDIIGKTNTKKEAEGIVKQIKKGTVGTKGFIVYSQDGKVGGGRRHTAEAIAGEAKIPFFAINTMDFGTKDVDLFGGGAMTPEASIKKIFSLVTTQAESNPNKSAMLFIENFEYFSVGELVSEYHQKAMAQLIREMNNAERKGLNIVVMGSVADPRLIGEAAMKSFKFNDNIEVASTAYDKDERYDVLKHAFDSNGIKISGTAKEQDKLLSDMAKTLGGFSFMQLKSFVKKADAIAQERNHKKVTKSDMIEAYLRITTGRPATSSVRQHEKELTTKHECGHAITLQIMNDLMKKTNRPWLVPNTVNFITLDPRSYYGGAMYPKTDENSEYSFERMFSDIVCSYGGHSSEKLFYGMDGSWGISGDLQNVTSTAELMVKAMGQGYKTGKISFADDESGLFATEKMREKMEDDIDVITRNALTVSDEIVNVYSDFINSFAEKYADRVGTGDCIIDGDAFRKELAEWKKSQSIEKQADFDILDDMILDAINATKNGKLY